MKQMQKTVNEFNALLDTNINDVWSISDKNKFLIALDGWICKKCEYGERIDSLSEPEKVFYINTQLESEVNNGGFSQFLYNSRGDFANEIVPSLSIIGANRTADICKRVLLALGNIPQKDRLERENFLYKILTNDDVNELLRTCDTDFYQ